MPLINNKSNCHNEAYWLQMDELFALAEKKNLIIAVNKSDTEKFHQFTSMMRVTNTLNKAIILKKK